MMALEWLAASQLALPFAQTALQGHLNDQAAEKNAALQREFAQNGIRWRVEDARRAGLSPMAAIGTSGASASPVYVGADVSGMGQDISRAMQATRTQDERESKLIDLRLQGAELDNQYKAAQLAKINSAGSGPALPSPMDVSVVPGQSPAYRVRPADITASSAGAPAREAGAVNDYGFARTGTGLTVVPSSDIKNRIEDQMVPEAMWAFRNQLLPMLNRGTTQAPNPREFPLPPGFDVWSWNSKMQEWQPSKWPKQNKNPLRIRK